VEYVLNEGGFVHRDPGMPLIYNLNAAEKAPCWFRVTAQGEPGHASRPPPETAVTRLVEALELLTTWKLPIEVGPIVAAYYAAFAELDPRNERRFRNLERSLETDKDFRHAFMRDPGAAALVRNTLTPTVLHASRKTNVVPATAWAESTAVCCPATTAASS
jgi:acetylornithine deacetylase/succinyl-diaminopimelate desuccinylase-like protein